ncbi:MAG: hypothetical protein M0R51_01900 [Clostridia bacterium]|nr:hypothetical protein [Clostridia bacterium]
MDYKIHSQERYLERFKKSMNDLDYIELCEIGKDDSKGFLLEQVKRGAKRKVVLFNGDYVWCVFSGKKRILKTVYVVPIKVLKRIKTNIDIL